MGSARIIANVLPSNHLSFKVTREDLMLLIYPGKNPEHLKKLGGCKELLNALCVDPETGISSAPILKRSITMRVAMKDTHPQPPQIVVDHWKVTEEERQTAFGVNRLPPVRSPTIFEYMLAALGDKIMILLSVVSLISLGLGLYQDFGSQADPNEPKVHWVEGFSILVAVILIVFAASMNDLQKEKKFRKLNDKKEDRSVKGIRNGETQLISIYDILVGDMLLLEPGDVLAADGVLVSGMGLKCDESTATGESDTIKKSPIHDPILLSGSQVTEGIGKYVVTSVGVDSYFGKIMMAMRTEMEDTPLQIKLDGLAERIAKFGAAGAVLMFIILIVKYVITVMQTTGFGTRSDQPSGTAVANQILTIIMQSVAIIAIAVPEGLPLAVTLALAYATTRMMSDNCLVRVISACETMGNATTICSDKTGTLTQNRMTVVAGVIGKNVSFEGSAESSERLLQRIKLLPSDNCANPDIPIPYLRTKLPGLSADALFSRIMEGLSINSSIFETKDKSGNIEIIGSKTETALVEWVIKCGLDYKAIRCAPEISVVQVFPFASERKTMATIIKITKGSQPPIYRIHVKGASEIVLKNCDRIMLLPFSASSEDENFTSHHGSTNTGLVKSASDHSFQRHPDAIPAVGSRSNPATPQLYHLDSKLKRDCLERIERYAHRALRTICIAFRDFSHEEFEALLQGPIMEKVKEARQLEAQLKSADEVEAISSDNKSESVIQGRGERGDASETKSFESLPRPTVVDEVLSNAELLSYSAAFTEVLGQNLICAAIVGIEDPIRPGVPEAVRTCQKAGVFVRMVTGDNLTTAISIAKKCGIYTKQGICMEGSKFRQMSPKERDEVLPRLQVLARSSPTDKQLLVASLKGLGDIVAVTGDGTNDGPALKLADIGFSMGIAGTEVAKEASSIILMDDSFSSVVKAIIWGRCVNDSVKKFLQFQLSVNVSAMIITLISSILDASESSVLTVVQLLWVNLIIDTLAALSLGTEKPMPDVLDRPPETRTSPLINFVMWKMILGQAVLQVVINLSLLLGGAQFFQFNELIEAGGILGIPPNASPQAQNERLLLRTIVFNTFVLMQMFNQVNCRRINSNLNIFTGIFQNPFFGCIFISVICVQAIIVQFGGSTFQTTPLNGPQWAFCVLVGFTSIPWGLVIRLIPNEFSSSQTLPPTSVTVPLQSPASAPSANFRQSPHGQERPLSYPRLDDMGSDSDKVSRGNSIASKPTAPLPVRQLSLPRMKSTDSLKGEEPLAEMSIGASSPNFQAIVNGFGDAHALPNLHDLKRKSHGDALKKSIPELSRPSYSGSIDGPGVAGQPGQTQVFNLLRGQSRRRSSVRVNSLSIQSGDVTAPPIPYLPRPSRQPQ